MTRRPATRTTTLLLALVVAFLLAGCTGDDPGTEPEESASAEASPTFVNDFSRLEEQYEATLGVYAVDTGTEEVVRHRQDERFAHASTIKALLVGALVREQGMDELDTDEVTVGPEDLVPGSPLIEDALEEESTATLTVRRLAEGAVRFSDNTATNLLLERLGGPEALQEVLREVGDETTNVDRIEPALNETAPDDDRDTSTPEALAATLRTMTLEDPELGDEQAFLTDLLVRSTTGDELIRAGVPDGWEVGDKSGAATYGTRNDIAVVRRPDGDPIVVAIMSRRDEPEAEFDDELVANAMEIVVDSLQ